MNHRILPSNSLVFQKKIKKLRKLSKFLDSAWGRIISADSEYNASFISWAVAKITHVHCLLALWLLYAATSLTSWQLLSLEEIVTIRWADLGPHSWSHTLWHLQHCSIYWVIAFSSHIRFSFSFRKTFHRLYFLCEVSTSFLSCSFSC